MVRRASIATALFLLGVVAVVVPEALLARGTQQAKECFAKYAAPRGPETPHCGDIGKLLRIPVRFPWTANRARYRIEEIGVRTAHYEYVEAAAGKPQAAALALAAEAVEHQSTVVQNGTTRATMKELGPSVGAPDLGRDADELGDRRTLLERGEQWFNWRVRLSTLRAAFLAGDVEKAKSLAKRYAVDDPRDPDIRSAVAAVLCMGPDPQKGAEMLAFIQDDRASRRYEALSRNYGEVRAMLMACLAKRNLPPPPLPTNSQAGSADAVEERALLRLRLAGTPAAEGSRTTALATVARLLDGGPRNPGARLALLAALLATGSDHNKDKLIRYAEPKFDERPLAPTLALTALEWVTERRREAGGSDPPAILPGSTYLVAAHTIETLDAPPDEAAKKAVDEAGAKDVESNAVAQSKAHDDLVRIRGALLLEAAASLAREGNQADALQAADNAASALKLSPHAKNLLRSNVYWLCGDREKAFMALEMDSSVVHGANAQEKQLLAAMSAQESELAMALGKTDVAKQAAHRAEGFATESKDPVLFARARWMLAALGELKFPPPSFVDLNVPRPFPSMGFANPSNPWRAGDHERQVALLDRALAPWVGLAGADANLQRAGRWAAIQSRGDAPPWLAVHLLLASRLLPTSEGDAEVWFDALVAMDQRRFSLRSYAFARAEAARMRGDQATAATWDERYRTLCKVAAEVPHYEFTRHLDI